MTRQPNSTAAVTAMWTDNAYLIYSLSTGTTDMSLEGSGHVIVEASKALGGPYLDTQTHVTQEETRNSREAQILLFKKPLINSL